jgi:hypothetical protein
VPFAVLQQTLDIPDVERLKRAFHGVPGLVEADAYGLARDAFGILVKCETVERAALLQGSLRREGIETQIVDEADLPVLPPTKFLRRVECLPEGLRVFDTLDRDFLMPWGQVLMIAAGSVKVSTFERVRVERDVHGGAPPLPGRGLFDRTPRLRVEQEVGYDTKEQQSPHLMIEILLGQNAARLSITADRNSGLLFHYLGERRTASLPQNFALLVRDLAQFAPHALLNHGARQLHDGVDALFAYPSKNAFVEEILWRVWHWQTGQPPGG